MGKNGSEFFDDEVVFATYTSRRETRVDSPNDTLEKPVFDELVGDLANLRILDLGCGNGEFGEDYFIALRARGFVVDALRESRPLRAQFQDEATYERRKRIPLMLFFSAHKPANTP